MKILLLGIGNVLYADEGVGVHFVNYLTENYRFTHPDHQIDLIDGGTAHCLIPTLTQYDHLIVVDTVNAADVDAGEVYFFDFDKAPPAEIDWQGSAHEVEMLQTLIMMELVGDRPKTYVLGVTPTVLEPMHMGLTSKIHAAILNGICITQSPFRIRYPLRKSE